MSRRGLRLRVTGRAVLVVLAVACAVSAPAGQAAPRRGAAGSAVSGADVFVRPAPVGSDGNNGTSPAAPVATLARARDVGRGLGRPYTVHVGGGEYRLPNEGGALTLNKQDAGSSWVGDYDSRFQAEPFGVKGDTGSLRGRSSVLHEAVAPAPWVLGSCVVPASCWQEVSGDSGLFECRDVRCPGLQVNATQVFVDGERLDPVRTPMLHWDRLIDPANKSSTVNANGFVVSPGDVPDTWNLSATSVAHWRVAVFHSWTKDYHRVHNFFPSNRTITFQHSASRGWGTDTQCHQQRYYFEGVPELQLRPGSGQFTISSGTSDSAPTAFCDPCRIVIAPTKSMRSPPDAIVEVPGLARLLTVDNAANVSVSLINFGNTQSYCTPGSACGGDCAETSSDHAPITAFGAMGLAVSDVTMTNCGAYCMSLVGANHSTIERIFVNRSAAGGIALSKSSAAVVNNSWMQGLGHRHPAGVGVMVSSSPHSIISHLDISGGFYNGIAGGNNDNTNTNVTVSHNVVHNNGDEGSMGICDYGGIHIGGAAPGLQTPFYITDNVFANITAFANGGEGIYLDVSIAGCVVQRNLVYHTSSGSFFWHINPDIPEAQRGQRTVVDNNVFVHSYASPWYMTRDRPSLTYDGYVQAQFTRNILVVDFTATNSTTLWEGKACASDENPKVVGKNCTNNFQDNFRDATVANNLYWNTSRSHQLATDGFPGGVTLAEWQRAGFESDSIVADPRFVDASASNFGLAPGSPALAMGIEPLDLRSAGPDWQPGQH